MTTLQKANRNWKLGFCVLKIMQNCLSFDWAVAILWKFCPLIKYLFKTSIIDCDYFLIINKFCLLSNSALPNQGSLRVRELPFGLQNSNQFCPVCEY